MEKLHTFIGEQYWSNLFVRYDEDDNLLVFYFHFKKASFWERLKISVTYVFFPNRFPDKKARCFIVFMLKTNDKTRMINLIRKLRE